MPHRVIRLRHHGGVTDVVVKWSDRVDATVLLLAEASELLHRAAVLGHRCLRCGSDAHGQPYIVGAPYLHVSLARSAGLSLVALTEGGPVGVDLERDDAAAFDGFARAALHPDERARTAQEGTRTWVRKEAVLKATGQGLGVDPRAVRISEARQPPALMDWQAPDDPGEVWLADVPVTDGWSAAVAVITPMRHELVLDDRRSPMVDQGRHVAR
jgi:4'-phosphopantetheinyl transferase